MDFILGPFNPFIGLPASADKYRRVTELVMNVVPLISSGAGETEYSLPLHRRCFNNIGGKQNERIQIIKTDIMGSFDSIQFPVYTIKYEGGLPGFQPGPALIQIKDDIAELKIMVGLSRKTITITPNDIIEVELNQEIYRSGGKAAAGAIIGGLLTGGIGLIAGAALGGKRRKENHLHLVIKYTARNCEVLISPNKEIPKIYAGLKTLLAKQTIRPVIENPSDDKTKNDAASEIERLYELLQKGMLTQEEFDAKKKILLGI